MDLAKMIYELERLAAEAGVDTDGCETIGDIALCMRKAGLHVRPSVDVYSLEPIAWHVGVTDENP